MARGTCVDDGGWSLFLQVAMAVERLGNVWSWVRGDVTVTTRARWWRYFSSRAGIRGRVACRQEDGVPVVGGSATSDQRAR